MPKQKILATKSNLIEQVMLMESKSSFSGAHTPGSKDGDAEQMSNRLQKVSGGKVMIQGTPKIKKHRRQASKKASTKLKKEM